MAVSYDWNYLYTRKPFYTILREIADLAITVRQGGYGLSRYNIYEIRIDYAKFKNRFADIISRIKNTCICKNNAAIREWVGELTDSKRDMEELIIDCCIKNANGKLQWDIKQ